MHEKNSRCLSSRNARVSRNQEKITRALDLKAKDLIGHLWVSLIIDQSECLVCFLSLHWINSFLHCLKKKPLHCSSANQNGEIFSFILFSIQALVTSGMKSNARPSWYPWRWTPRKKKMISKIRGNVAVTYTICKKHYLGSDESCIK